MKVEGPRIYDKRMKDLYEAFEEVSQQYLNESSYQDIQQRESIQPDQHKDGRILKEKEQQSFQIKLIERATPAKLVEKERV